MRLVKQVIITSLFALTLASCESTESGSVANNTNLSASLIGSAYLSDASSLLVAPTNAGFSTSLGKPVAKQVLGSSAAKAVYKIKTNGTIEVVTYKDKDGQAMTTTQSPVRIINVNADYVVIAYGTDKFNIDTTLLFRKSDGAAFDVEEQLYYTENGVSDDVQTDSNSNAYLIVRSTGNVGSPSKIIKIDLSNPQELTKSRVTPETDIVNQTFQVDNAGNVIYTSRGDSDVGTTFSRIIKANGGLQNVPYSYLLWRGLDGYLYNWPFSGSDLSDIKKHILDSNGNYTAASYDKSACTIAGFNNSIARMQNAGKIFLISTTNICEVYNSSMTIRQIDPQINPIKNVGQSNNYYYLSGNDANSDPVLRRFDPTDDSTTDVLTAGLYDIYKFSVSANDEIQFNALRMSDGKKVIGAIAPNGTVSILDEAANVEITTLKRIN